MADILLVDDEESLRNLLKRGLELDGHRVEAASDGGEGLAHLRERQGAFDLIVSDIRMPGTDGIALAHSAKREYPVIPILLMTGYAEQRERAQELESIVEDVLAKPFSIGELRAAVQRILAL